MLSDEQNLYAILKDLKNNYQVLSLKTEFGEEGSTSDEAKVFKHHADGFDLDLVIKTGGCESVRDLCDAKSLGVSSIVAPMIESVYAVKKFIRCVQNVYGDNLSKMRLYINIETISGYNSLDDILNSDISKYITGVVMGRTDFSKSLGMGSADINSEIVFDYANEISKKVYESGKEFIIGGGVSIESLEFFRKLKFLSKLETRNIIFDAKKFLSNENPEQGIIKAIQFEILRLKNKQNIIPQDIERIQILESRCYMQELNCHTSDISISRDNSVSHLNCHLHT